MSFPVEEVIDDVQKVPRKIINRIRTSPSLKPGQQVIEGCLVKNPMAMAIRDAWAFRESRATKVTVVSREEFAAMVEKAGQ